MHVESEIVQKHKRKKLQMQQNIGFQVLGNAIIVRLDTLKTAEVD